MSPCIFFDLKVTDTSFETNDHPRIEFYVNKENKDMIQLLFPDLDFTDISSIFNITESYLKKINKKLKEISYKNEKVKLIVEPRVTKKEEFYLLLTNTIILP